MTEAHIELAGPPAPGAGPAAPGARCRCSAKRRLESDSRRGARIAPLDDDSCREAKPVAAREITGHSPGAWHDDRPGRYDEGLVDGALDHELAGQVVQPRSEERRV